MRYPILTAMLLLALAGCDRTDPPADKIKDAAKDLVQQIDGTAPPQLDEGIYAPRDECTTIPGADAFREKLAEAVEARDVDGLVALAASDVQLDFGGGSGSAELRKRLSDDDWKLWDKLDTLLTLGCAANDQGGITLPWIFAQHIPNADPMMAMLVTGERIPMYAEPGTDSAVVKLLSWDIVDLAAGLQPNAKMQKVKLPDGTIGYVATGKLRSLIDYRLIASSRNGNWSFTRLIAGD